MDSFIEADIQKDDLQLIKFLNKQIGKYRNSGKINTRLALNQLIILNNVFEDKTPSLLFNTIPEERWSTLATLMRHLDCLPGEVLVENKRIQTDTIMSDDSITFEIIK